MVDHAPRILAGRYQVGELIGRGGMADVHIGHDTRLGRTVAIKVLRSDLARDPAFQARFRREAQAAASLNHPSIVSVYDTGEDMVQDPTGATAHVPFIVMEYVEGQTVRDILRGGQAVPINEAVEIMGGVLAALEYSHRAGIVHRDIKPANVMITPTGAVKVMDFGIARAVADSGATMTQTQSVIGTAQYLSPEQARGETVDARSDLYSAGCLLYELLTGRPPFTGDSPVSVAYQHVLEAPPAPSTIANDVPETLDRITLRALAKDRDNRYSSSADFHADLEAFLRGGALNAPSIGAVTAAATGNAAPGANATPLSPQTDATQVYGAPVPGAQGPATQTAPTAPWAPVAGAGLAGGAVVGAGMAGAQAAPGVPGAPMVPPTQYNPGGPGGYGTPGGFGDQTGVMPTIPEDKSNRNLIIILASIGAVLLGVVLWIIFSGGGGNTPTTETVKVPDMTGMTADQARTALEDLNLTYVLGEAEQNDEIPNGLFVRSTPPVGEEVATGTEVTVHFSTGPTSLQVPDVADMTPEDAIALLEAEGFNIAPNRESENHPTIAAGRVTRTTPEAGSTQGSGAAITLFISNGKVIVPDLTGKSKEDATTLLNEAGLRPNFQEAESDAHPAGTVMLQDPAGNTEVNQGTTVTVTIAKEPVVQTVTIPEDIIGSQRGYATGLLRGLGLEVRDTTRESSRPAGEVLESNPGPRSQVPVGSTVTLVISSGPTATTPPPTTTPPEEGGE